MTASGQLTTVFAIVQQRLIPSKINDVHGFELLQTAVRTVPPMEIQKYYKDLLLTLFTRLQSGKTDKYVYQIAYFLFYTMALPKEELGPDFVIQQVESIQPG